MSGPWIKAGGGDRAMGPHVDMPFLLEEVERLRVILEIESHILTRVRVFDKFKASFQSRK